MPTGSEKHYRYRGDYYSVAQLAETFGIGVHVLHMRLNNGWPVSRAVHRPVSPNESRDVEVARCPELALEYGNETRSLREWAEHLGMDYMTLYQRLYVYGWPVSRAFTAKVVSRRPKGPTKEKSDATQAEPAKKRRAKRGARKSPAAKAEKQAGDGRQPAGGSVGSVDDLLFDFTGDVHEESSGGPA